MVAARSAAMGFNRLVDAALRRARTPGRPMRELPRGAMSPPRGRAFVVVASVVFVVAACAAEPALPRAVAGRPGDRLLVLAGQALHALDAVVPRSGDGGGAGRRLAGRRAAAAAGSPGCSALAIGAWVGGFDVLYACQDLDVRSARTACGRFPSASACPRRCAISRAMHVVAVACLAALGARSRRSGPIYLAGRRGWSRRCSSTSSRSSAPTTCRRSSARST